MKKLISLILCLTVVLPLAISATALTANDSSPEIVRYTDYLLGDANCDGNIDVKDVFAIKMYNAVIGDIDTVASDIIHDGKVNAKDLLAIKKHFAGDASDSLSNNVANRMMHQFTIGGIDVSSFEIVYPEGAKYVENIYYAADTLADYICRATGAELPVVTGSASANKIEFVDVTTVEGLEEKLGIEGYKYEVSNGDLYIYGTYRGSLYAVWEILEDYLGFGFYSDAQVIHHLQDNVDIPEDTNEFHIPALSMRGAYDGFSEEGAEIHYLPRRLNSSHMMAYNGEAYGTLTGSITIPDEDPSPAHFYYRMSTGVYDVDYETEGGLAYKAKFEAGKDHIKHLHAYYNSPDWAPCFTSDEEYETLFRGILETLRYVSEWQKVKGSATAYIPLNNYGSRQICSCQSCQFIMKDGTTGRDENKKERLNAGESGLWLHLANRVAKDITKYYEGRAASIEGKGGYDSNENYAGYGAPIYDEYPNIKVVIDLYSNSTYSDVLFERLFTDERYRSLIPSENIIIQFREFPCNNHIMGSGECGNNTNIVNYSGKETAEVLKLWGDVVKQSNTELWFEYSASQMNVSLFDSPNIFNIWHDFKFLVEECGVSGITLTETGHGYNFEHLKTTLAAKLMWSFEYDENGNISYMSYEEYVETIKEYLKLFYGDGWEELYRYIEMMEEAGNESGICFTNICDYPGDMLSHAYIVEHYEKMRALLVSAYEKAKANEQKEKINNLLISYDFIGLTACHKDYYVNGSEELRAIYSERYNYVYNFIIENGIESEISPYDEDYPLMVRFYAGGTWREELDEQWYWLHPVPGYGI